MRRFERSSHCLTPVPTAHAAEACFCRLPQNQKNSLDYLSMHDLELDTGHVRFKVEHTGMGTTVGGQEIVPTSPTRVEEG